jgi:hypothetical protein
MTFLELVSNRIRKSLHVSNVYGHPAGKIDMIKGGEKWHKAFQHIHIEANVSLPVSSDKN